MLIGLIALVFVHLAHLQQTAAADSEAKARGSEAIMTLMPFRTSGSLHLRLRVQPHCSQMWQDILQPRVKNKCMEFITALRVRTLMIVLMMLIAIM